MGKCYEDCTITSCESGSVFIWVAECRFGPDLHLKICLFNTKGMILTHPHRASSANLSYSVGVCQTVWNAMQATPNLVSIST